MDFVLIFKSILNLRMKLTLSDVSERMRECKAAGRAEAVAEKIVSAINGLLNN